MTPEEYNRMIRRARRQSLAVQTQVASNIERSLQAYIGRLGAALQGASGPQARRLRQTRAAAQQALRGLRSSLEDAIGRGIRLSASRVADIQDRATRQFVEERAAQQLGEEAASGFVAQFTEGPNLRGASAYLARLRDGDVAVASRFVTILERRTPQVAREVDHILTRSIIEGADPAEVGRNLRGYVTGSEDFGSHLIVEREDGEVVGRKIDLRTVPEEAKGAARNLRYKANRIAVTEMDVARHEATVQGMKESPMVGGVRWNTSATRGSVGVPDECDVLEEADYYGLGDGVYPPESVPAKPHPFCRCYTTAEMRPVEEWGAERPSADLSESAGRNVVEEGTETRRERATEQAQEAVTSLAGVQT